MQKISAKKYESRHDWEDKVIDWEPCKKFITGVSTTQNPSCKFLWDFETQTDHQVSVRRLDLQAANKRKETYRISDFTVAAEQRVKIKNSKKRDKYQDLARELKNNFGTW